MRTVAFEHKLHYAMICDWWTRQKFTPIAPELLPQRGLVVQSDEGIPLCVGFLYSTDSAMGWVEFIVGNPDARRRDVSHALDRLLECLVDLSKLIGHRALFTSSNLKGLVKRFTRAGFTIGDINTTQLVRGL
jgi:hypothetical protein